MGEKVSASILGFAEDVQETELHNKKLKIIPNEWRTINSRVHKIPIRLHGR